VINHARLNGRLLEITFHIAMPHVENFEIFCTSLMKKLKTMAEIHTEKRLSVWIKALYGGSAEISLCAVTLPMSLEHFDALQTKVFIEAQKIALSLNGGLTIPPLAIDSQHTNHHSDSEVS